MNMMPGRPSEYVPRDEELPRPGAWPCQTEVPGGAAIHRVLPPRLVEFLYLLLRDGASAPGDVEQKALNVVDASYETDHTNQHLLNYARALTVYLLYRERGVEEMVLTEELLSLILDRHVGDEERDARDRIVVAARRLRAAMWGPPS